MMDSPKEATPAENEAETDSTPHINPQDVADTIEPADTFKMP
jgi:hypothetical protein